MMAETFELLRAKLHRERKSDPLLAVCIVWIGPYLSDRLHPQIVKDKFPTPCSTQFGEAPAESSGQKLKKR